MTGFIVRQLFGNELLAQDIHKINRSCIFVLRDSQPRTPVYVPVFHLNKLYNFTGVLIATDFITARQLKLSPSERKIIYLRKELAIPEQFKEYNIIHSNEYIAKQLNIKHVSEWELDKLCAV